MAKPLASAARFMLLAGSLVSFSRAAVPALVGNVYISSASPTTNFNTGAAAQNLIVAPGDTALVQFDLSPYPTSSVVNGASPTTPSPTTTRPASAAA